VTPSGSFLRHLLTPFCAPVVMFVGVTTLLGAIAARAGMFGLPLALLVSYAIVSYALVLVEAGSHGKPVPVLSIEMINPAHHARPLGLLALVAIATGSVAGVSVEIGPGYAYALAALFAFVLPAMIALLCVDDSWLSAVSPVQILRLLRALGVRYLAFLAVSAGYMALVAAIAPRVAWLCVGAVAQFASLGLAILLGGVLYDRRSETGIEAWVSPERDGARQDAAAEREREAVVHDMYGSMRANKPQAAWDSASRWLAPRGNQTADILWLRQRVRGWDDRRVADRLTRELITQYLRRAQDAAAMDTAQDWLASGGQYHPGSARELGRLIGLSRLAGRDALADELLDRCSAGHAEDPEISNLLARRARQTAPGG